ncbi:LOW QUALITY PROTEIN: hypothetical protein OSB04_019700 [Centaurea solstitialis]|uniref:Uncharacterized protein n=1 Tax=Centaurea solstitialis TaxID=347529 RepID=A0AA38W593_9ASTR|nr:LOW QUALITY PROTEIN: hypothetical protein OSB04_019700 [Centaurea solstitialis]
MATATATTTFQPPQPSQHHRCPIGACGGRLISRNYYLRSRPPPNWWFGLGSVRCESGHRLSAVWLPPGRRGSRYRLGLLPGLLEIDPPVNDQTEFPLAGSNPETLHEQTVREEHDQSETKPDLEDRSLATGRYILKVEKKYTEEDWKLVSLDTKVRAIIALLLPDEVYHSLVNFSTAKEIQPSVCRMKALMKLKRARNFLWFENMNCFLMKRNPGVEKSQNHLSLKLLSSLVFRIGKRELKY